MSGSWTGGHRQKQAQLTDENSTVPVLSDFGAVLPLSKCAEHLREKNYSCIVLMD